MEGTATGIELKLANGNVIKAATYEEALKVAVKMTEDTQAALKAEREAANTRTQELEARVNELASQVQRPAPVTNGGFDKQRYFNMLNEDPISAQNYVDSFRFGIDNPSEVPQHFQRISSKIDEYEGYTLAGLFLQQHAEDFPSNAENAAFLRTQMQELVKQGYPATLETMNMAYGQLVDNGKIKPLEPQQADPEVNPSLQGGGGQGTVSADELDRFNNMSTADMEKYLKSQGRL